jgi:hypothetical protein
MTRYDAPDLSRRQLIGVAAVVLRDRRNGHERAEHLGGRGRTSGGGKMRVRVRRRAEELNGRAPAIQHFRHYLVVRSTQHIGA